MVALTRSKFETGCSGIIAKYANGQCDRFFSQTLGGWSWSEHPTVGGLGYLTQRTQAHTVQSHSEAAGITEVDDLENSQDDATIAPIPDTLQVVKYVVFSPSFQVPAFYFAIHRSDGTPLPLDEIVKTSLFRDFQPVFERTDFALQLPASNFPLLSQGDHPTLGTPCWYIHPCETLSAMGELLDADPCGGQHSEGSHEQSVRWMELWFMLLGSIVNLRC